MRSSFRRSLTSALAACLAAGSAGATLILSVDGGLPIVVGERLDGKRLIVDDLSCSGGVAEEPCVLGVAGQWEVQIVAELNPDPSIVYGMAITDLGLPSSFSFVLSQGIAPTTAAGIVTASLSGSTTNGTGFPGPVSVAVNAAPGFIPLDGDLVAEIQVYTLSQNAGVTFLNAGLDLGPAFASNLLQASDIYGPFNAGPAAGPAGAGLYNLMRLDLNLGLSGGGDIFTFNGSGTVVPEPVSAGLLALGLACLIAARRRLS